jgi:hypothetical protein
MAKLRVDMAFARRHPGWPNHHHMGAHAVGLDNEPRRVLVKSPWPDLDAPTRGPLTKIGWGDTDTNGPGEMVVPPVVVVALQMPSGISAPLLWVSVVAIPVAWPKHLPQGLIEE